MHAQTVCEFPHTNTHARALEHAVNKPLFSFHGRCYLSLIGSAKTKEGPWMLCCSDAHSVYRDALCCINTYTGALDVADLCAVEKSPVLDYMAQFQGLYWISKQASALKIKTVFKHNMKTPFGLPRKLRPMEVLWTLCKWCSEAKHLSQGIKCVIQCLLKPFSH